MSCMCVYIIHVVLSSFIKNKKHKSSGTWVYPVDYNFEKFSKEGI